MEKRYDEQFRIVFEAITQLLEIDENPKKKIGYLKKARPNIANAAGKADCKKRQETPETSWQSE